MNRHRSGFVALGMAVALPLLGMSRAHGGLVISATFDASIANDPNAAAIEGTINQAIQVYENALHQQHQRHDQVPGDVDRAGPQQLLFL